MNKLIAISVLSLGFVAGCQQRSETEKSSSRMTPTASPTAPAPATPMTPAPVPSSPSSQMPGRGEGEREQQMGSQGMDASGGAAVADGALGEQYRQEISSDADLAATASSTQLVAESGQLFLRGTVASEDLKDSLGEMAKALADGRDVTNEITVSAQ